MLRATRRVLELEEAGDLVGVFGGEAELGSDPPVPELGERLGQLHDEAVELVVVAVGVLGEELRGAIDRSRSPARG